MPASHNFVFITLLACSDSSTSSPLDAGGARPDAPRPRGPMCSETNACEGESPSSDATCIVSLDAKLVDLAGTPIAGETIFVCGENICTSPIPSDNQGKIHSDICLWFTGAAFKYLGGAR